MERYRKLWWTEEIDHLYKLLIYFSYIFGFISIFSRVITFLWTQNIAVKEALIFPSFHVVMIIFLKFSEKWGPLGKNTAAMISTEIYNIVCFTSKLFMPSQLAAVFQSFSFVLMTQLQLPMIRNKYLLNFFLFKYIYTWFFHDIIFNSAQMSVFQFNTIVAIIVLINVGIYYKQKLACERSLYLHEIEESKDRFKIISQAFSDGIVVVSSSNEIEFINDNILKLLNCSQNEIYSELSSFKFCPDRKVSDFEISDLLIDHINYAFHHLDSSEITLGITRLNNVYLQWKVRKIVWENHNSLFLTVRNVNKIIELEKRIADDNMKTVLLRSVSHELRTPLNAISFFVNDLLNKPNMGKDSDEYNNLKIVSISSKLMLSLIDDLLDYSKMLAGAFSIKKIHCDFRQIVSNAFELISLQAKKKKLNLICRIDPSIPERIYTDPLRLSQVLLNILSNALKFTLSGSIEICCVLGCKNQLKIYVEDTGIGMTEEVKQKLFTEFSTNNIPSINPQGCGLGLCISNILTKALGSGPIKVKSIQGEGSTFKFSLDIFEETTRHLSWEKVMSIEKENVDHFDVIPYMTATLKEPIDVLIVDDNDFNRAVLGSILSQLNISYQESCDGKEAINKILAYDEISKMYKVVIMDCCMPDINGYEATKIIVNLYKDKILKKLPIIVGYSAYSSDEDRNACFECGMVDCMPKPCPPDTLANIIKKYL